jgi:hypothetical protein
MEHQPNSSFVVWFHCGANQSRMSTFVGVRRPNPTPFTARPQKMDIPLLASVLNRHAHPLPPCHAAEIRAMLFDLQLDFSEGTAPITSNDMLVILDSGCTCAISFDKNDFVGPTHPGQNVQLQGKNPQQPGNLVSVDQMVDDSLGLIPFTSGRPSQRRYTMVTMWFYHFSRFLYAHCQEDATTKSTLESKIGFESLAKQYNVSVKHIHGNNGVFASRTFQDHVAASDRH